MAAPGANRQSFYRHRLPVRVAHWINVLCMFLILLSGLQIFNAHPRLYWGHASDFDAPWLELGARRSAGGGLEGFAYIAGADFTTTGVLGLSETARGQVERRGFPGWLTIPSYRSLASGRRWHFFFAWLMVINGLAYLVWSVASGHLRDLTPTRADWRSLRQSVIDHLLLRHPRGEAARRYNILQKLAYLVTIFGLGGLVILTGLCMSPQMDTALDWALTLFGGRQSARSLHFIAAGGLVLFVVIHLFEVVVTGLWNNLRSMITGRFTYLADDTEIPQRGLPNDKS